MRYEIRYSCISNIGRIRSINQDNFICDGTYMEINDTEIKFPLSGKVSSQTPSLFGVLDGMGGEECGEVASFIAAREAAATQLCDDGVATMTEYCERANTKICEYAKDNMVSTMGTTAAMLMFSQNEITLCNIGDSKIFRYSNGELEQISKDHVAVAPFGTKPPLSQSLGIPPEELIIEPYFSQGGYENGDRYLICSDGLTDMLTPDEIVEILERSPIEQGVSELVNKALENGGKDNVTVMLFEIKRAKNNLFKFFNR